ncbi:hypothetical protein UlMin_015778 [Ulmus minor]
MFRRIYICLVACTKGWLATCRPIIGLDSCHIKGYHKCQLMWAVGIDSDNGYNPIAYGVVEKECYETWRWFLELLKIDLKLDNLLRITFMTNRQKGLVDAIAVLWERCEHRNCVRHLYANFKKRFRGDKIRNKILQAARCSNVDDFNNVMEDIKGISEFAWLWLSDKPTSTWTKSHFGEYSKCDMLLNNLCELSSSDRIILEARSAPIWTMLELIQVMIMNRRSKRRVDIEKWYNNVGPKVSEIMELATKNSGELVCHWGGEGNWQVSQDQIPITVVDLERHTCICRC